MRVDLYKAGPLYLNEIFTHCEHWNIGDADEVKRFETWQDRGRRLGTIPQNDQLVLLETTTVECETIPDWIEDEWVEAHKVNANA